jgi:hypothetical protein
MVEVWRRVSSSSATADDLCKMQERFWGRSGRKLDGAIVLFGCAAFDGQARVTRLRMLLKNILISLQYCLVSPPIHASFPAVVNS